MLNYQLDSKCSNNNHTKNEKDYLCKKCNQVGCARCMAEHLGKCGIRDYEVISLSDQNSLEMKNLNELQTTNLADGRKNLQLLQDKIEENHRNYEISYKKFNEVVADMTVRVDSTKDKLKAKIETEDQKIVNEYNESIRKIDSHENTINENLNALESLEQEIKARLDELGNETLYRQFKQLSVAHQENNSWHQRYNNHKKDSFNITNPNFNVELIGLEEYMNEVFMPNQPRPQ